MYLLLECYDDYGFSAPSKHVCLCVHVKYHTNELLTVLTSFAGA